VGRDEIAFGARRPRRPARFRAAARVARITATFAVVLIVALVAGLAHVASAEAKLRIVTTTTDLRSLAMAVGGEHVEVVNLVPAGVDHEAFEPRPGDLLKLRGAALVVRVGLGYDHWLDKLLTENGDPGLMRGGSGYVDASFAIPLLEVRGRAVEPQAAGHAHGVGNPHYWLDPANAETITAVIAERLVAVAPELRVPVTDNRNRFLATLNARLQAWTAALERYAGASVVVYHNSWPYLARRFRLNVVGIIEPKEGVSPSPAHLARLARIMREARVQLIIREPYEPEDAPKLLARQTGAQVLVLAPSVGSVAAAGDYLALFDHNVDELTRGLRLGSQ